jgi:hypothetical protein
VVADSGEFLDPEMRSKLEEKWAPHSKEQRVFDRESGAYDGWLRRQAFAARRLLEGSKAARDHLGWKLGARPAWEDAFPELVRNWLAGAGMGACLVAVEDESKSASPVVQGAGNMPGGN